MRPKEVIEKWVEAFNNANVTDLISFYGDEAINYQVPNTPIQGKEEIKKMFEEEFAQAKMVCIIENILKMVNGQF